MLCDQFCHRAWTVCTWQGYRPNLQRVLHSFIRPTPTRSFRRLYLDGAEPRWLCCGPNRQCVLVVCYLSFARIYRFLWDLLKTRRSVTLRSGNHRWYSSASARACRGGYKCNVCRHIVQCYPLRTAGTQNRGQWARENKTIGIRPAITGSATRSEAFRPPDGVVGIPLNRDMDLAAHFLLYLAILSAV